ncbi:hypothetical protein CJ030_MR7G028049 [Morella rubra]|uniref:Transmembrane protein 214-A n=1 Tax=Morella rubra TaxID=262757 RepID=A0A6A1V0A9_9ROSI|nr:hypothetical protein CJ030_MR7G028049 [Morella rubra]
MEDKLVAFESSSKDEHAATANGHANNSDHGWQKVTYGKRQRKTKFSDAVTNASKLVPNGTVNGADNVFRSLEQQSEDRRRRILEAQQAATNGIAPARSKHLDDYEDAEDSDTDGVVENGKAEDAKKVKPKKTKKPKVTISEAASKIDADYLSAFLAEISVSFESQQDIQLMRFADYFGHAFSAVSSAQFPWVKMFRESTVAKFADIPLSHISETVYKISVDWINRRSLEALGSFVLWSLDSIFADLVTQQASAKGSRKRMSQVSSKSQVAMFVVLAMVLRRKPDVLVNLLPTLRENPKYQGQDRLPVIIWMVVQSCQGDLTVGLYAWACNLLPGVSGKSCNTQSRDLVLQLMESRILSTPKARSILINGAVRKGERLIPPSAFEILMRVTFPASSARVKATERFEAMYPILKEVALTGSRGRMKQVSQQILSFAIKMAGESAPGLSKEATDIFIWCLTQNANCFKQWDEAYEDNLEASVAALKKLSGEWKDLSVKLSPLDPLKETLKSFRNKNEKALASGTDAAHQALSKDADKYCKAILGRASRGNWCMRMSFAALSLPLLLVLLSNLESSDWNKLSTFFSSQQSS